MARPTYAQLLLDPRWQRKRLEILSAADFTCATCCAQDKTLHVHHTYYKKGLKPWEYPNSALRCLCADCHSETEEVLAELRQVAGQLKDWWHVRQVIGYCRTIVALNSGPERVVIGGDHDEFGIADAVHGRASDVSAACGDDLTVDVVELAMRFGRPFYAMHAALNAKNDAGPVE